MAETSISWTDYTWNPTRGCSRISPGCVNCYAERIAARFSGPNCDHGLPGNTAPFDGFAIRTSSGAHWTGKVELIQDKLLDPLHWKKPRKVFVNSMSDLFHENLPDESINRVFAVMALTPHITYQVLTKRAERMRKYFEPDMHGVTRHARQMIQQGRIMADTGIGQPTLKWPLPNVWLGVSVEDEPNTKRIIELLRTPAAKRFVSYEPALGPVNFHRWTFCQTCHEGRSRDPFECPEVMLDWGIIGGESGPSARPFRLDWLRSTIRDFRAAGTPLFVKQMGARPVSSDPEDLLWITKLDSKGENWKEWPKDLRVRQFPK